jgi:Domain of unknown function (DUF4062)
MPNQTKKQPLRIMVASSVYGFEDQLNQICATLTGFGYEVWNSHLKTMPVNPKLSNLENCLLAVQNCDIFLGIIWPSYGSGVIGDYSITHQEFRKALALDKPRWIIAHHYVTIARQLLKPYRKTFLNNDTFKKTKILDDLRVIEMYEDSILNDQPIESRTGNWVPEFQKIDDLMVYINTQLKDKKRVVEIVENMKTP